MKLLALRQKKIQTNRGDSVIRNATVKIPDYTIGPDAIKELKNLINKLGSRILIVGGKRSLQAAQEKIEGAIKESKVGFYDFIWYGGECTYNNMEKIKLIAKEKDFNLIIGVGGGKAIDTAKGAAEKAGIPIVTIPTIASTCAATTALSVVYTEENNFDSIYLLDNTPIHILIDTEVIGKSPWQYQWAGIGDTLAKYYEVSLTTRGKELDYNATFAKTISQLCKAPLIKYGQRALQSNKSKEISFEMDEVILSIIFNTGLVSLLVGEENNGAGAHGLFYGMTILEEIEKNHLHGEVIAYGILVMLMIDNNREEVESLIPFYKKINLPICLKDIGLTIDDVFSEKFISKALNSPDMKKMPYKVDKDMLLRGIQSLEEINRKN